MIRPFGFMMKQERHCVDAKECSHASTTWSFPLSANEADLLGQHFFLDKFLPNCFSMLDEQYTSAGKQALGAR
ncbi:MAG: hypothetical protein V1755_01440, partial [Chloroflexota bacterium]